MTLRLQQETMTSTCSPAWSATTAASASARPAWSCAGPQCRCCTPGPVNRGVEMSGDLLDDPERCLVEEQVRNGIPMRMALLYLLAARSDELREA